MWSDRENADYFGEPQEEDKDPPAIVEDLAMLLRKAAYALKRVAPVHPLAIEVARKATDYLRRHGLDGSPLRADDGPVTPNV